MNDNHPNIVFLFLFAGIILLILVVAKLIGLLNLSWWLITSPAWSLYSLLSISFVSSLFKKDK